MASCAASALEHATTWAEGRPRVGLVALAGRAAELQNVLELSKASRAISLVGPGGIGKSWLARRCAEHIRDALRRETYLVDIDELPPGPTLARAVAAVVGLAGASFDQVLDRVSRRHIALVLDNCDSRVGECAAVAAHLLQRAPGLQLLMTSRERLGVDGELVALVPPLGLPRAGTADLAEVEASDAVRLFIDAVRALDADLTVTQQNAAVLAELCQRAGGSPMLIEALAAHTAREGVARTASKLSATFLLDVENPHPRAARHRSLRDSLLWDCALLNPTERLLLARLGVFTGGWSLESAESVCTDALLPVADVGAALSRLAARGLVLVDPLAEAPRYAMQDNVREFALQQLPSSGDLSALRQRQAERLVALGVRVRRADALGAAVVELESERDNLVQALHWALGTRKLDLAFRSGLVGYLLWYRRNRFPEGRMWLGRLLERHPTGLAAGLWGYAACGAGHLALLEADIAAARQLARRALTAHHRAGEPVGKALALFLQSLIALGSADVRARLVVEQTEAALRKVRVDDDLKKMLQLAVPLVHARIALELGDLRGAGELVGRVAAIARARADRFWLPRVLHAQALVAMRKQQPTSARWLVERSVAMQTANDETDGLVDSLCALGDIELSVGTVQAGFRTFNQAFEIAERAGLRLGQLRALDGLACATAVTDTQAALRLAAAGASLRVRTGARAWPAQRRRLLFALQRGAGHPVPINVRTAPRAGTAWTWAEVSDLVREVSQPEADTKVAQQNVLTPREREVARLVAQGLSNQQIATRLSISVGTARAHVEHILLKLGFHSRAQVALWAMREQRLST